MSQHNQHLTPDEARQLIDRYFMGETTEQEEARLRTFLCSTDGRAYDDVSATMSFLAVGHRLHRRQPHRVIRSQSRLLRPLAAAATLAAVLVLGVAGWFYHRHHDLCLATVAGHELSREQATELMLTQMHDMFNPANESMP
ncbi:MAG: hypothetical protein K5945_03060 [Bacteroidaceae bacterium]|nr:hypothetical protein [Bacteroidaceae bacterium]